MGEKEVGSGNDDGLWTRLARVYVENCPLVGDNARQDVYLVLKREQVGESPLDDSVGEDHS